LDRGRKTPQRIERIDKPHQPLWIFRHYFILC
jgi:hypothetical protein